MRVFLIVRPDKDGGEEVKAGELWDEGVASLADVFKLYAVEL